MKNPDLSGKILLLKWKTALQMILVSENYYKILVPLFGATKAAPNKGTTILYRFRSQKSVLNPPVKGKIQGFFKAFECFSSAFQDKFNFKDFSRQPCIFKYFSSLWEPWDDNKRLKILCY